MARAIREVCFKVKPINQNLAQAIITIPSVYVDALYDEVVVGMQDTVTISGFSKGNVPGSYIKQHFKSNICEHVKEFLFNYCVVHYLYHHLYQQKLLVAGEPRLDSICVEPHCDAKYIFELSLAQPVELLKWRTLPFKAPKRKNYKDIDRQVDTFIKEEQVRLSKMSNQNVEIGDWVHFDIQPLNGNNKELFKNHVEALWLKIGNEEADTPFFNVFVDKQIGDSFITHDKCIQHYFSSHVSTNINFKITINNIIKDNHFEFDYFKRHFKLKTNKDVHKKLIEVFSYRNDFSLRRSFVEEALKLLINSYRLEAPSYLVLRQQKKVLDTVIDNPDYQVFKTHPNFKNHVKKLAEKQSQELLIVDQITLEENISITSDDIAAYINLLKRPRKKEFIYFDMPASKLEEQEIPLNQTLLEHCCRREKALNHIIYHLTRQ